MLSKLVGLKMILIGMLSFSLVVATACAAEETKDAPAVAPKAPAAAPAAATKAPAAAPAAATKAPVAAGGFVVDASDFLEEFEKNAVAATGKYKDQEVTVTGTVETIDFDFMDNPYIAITGGGMFEVNSVWCMIDDTSQSAGLDSGDDVTVVGTFKEWNILIGTLGNCSVK